VANRVNKLRIISLNINGNVSKLENTDVFNLIKNYDIITLSEIKTNYPFTIPGYNTIRSGSYPGEDLRGGVAI
jgi:exonuclease III